MGVKKNKVKEVASNLIDVEECVESPVNETEDVKQNKRILKKNVFNVNKVRNRLSEEYAHISNIFDILNLNRGSLLNGVNENGSTDDVAVSAIGANNNLTLTGKSDYKTVKIKNVSANGNITKISWPKTLEGLVEARKLFKGKKLTYHEKLLKRNLKTRLTRKRKKLEFQMKLEGKKGKKEGLIAEELLKTKKIKPVYNSEGKIVHSKYDFSEIGTKKDLSQKFIKDINEISLSNNMNEHKLKNDINTGADIESDREPFSKKAKDSTKQKGVRKKKKKNKLIDNNSVASIPESEQEPVKNKLKISADKSNSISIENESVDKIVTNKTFKPVFNKDNKMIFSKIDFPDTKLNKKGKKIEDKDPKKLLQKLKMNKAKIDELESSGAKEKAVELVETEKWMTALRKASGEKVKDDPQLLKKTIMREKSRKKKSKKKWEARIDTVKKKQQEKQKKRMENIMAKKKEKKKKKVKKAVKKGRFPM